jgi:hypothetical protein
LINEATGNPHANRHSAIAASPLVIISILNWNGWEETLECLDSVRRLDYANYLTVVVDNGSRNDSVDRICAWAKGALPDQAAFVEYRREMALAGGDPNSEVRLDAAKPPNRFVLIRNQDNLGFTGGNNVAISYALSRGIPADYVLLLNNDATVRIDCLQELVNAAVRSSAGVVTAEIFDPISGTFAPQFPLERRRKVAFGSPESIGAQETLAPEVYEVNWAGGCSMLLSRQLLKALHSHAGYYLDDRLFIYCEDVALSQGAHKLGYKVVVARKAVADHKGGRRAGAMYNVIRSYYGTRNTLLLTRDLPHGRGYLSFLTYTFLSLARIGKNMAAWRFRSAQAIYCGLVDGYCGVTGRWKSHDRVLLPKEVPSSPVN